MDIKSIRRYYLEQLNILSTQVAYKTKQEKELHRQLFEMKFWQNASVVALYLSLPIELDTLPIITQAQKEGKGIVVPKMMSKTEIEFVEYRLGDPVTRHPFGVFEPVYLDICALSDIDLMIVPGVVFDRLGNRIGYGGGYYDRILKRYNGNTVSLVFKEQLIDKLMPQIHDERISNIITM